MRVPALFAPLLLAASANARFVMYHDQWHPDRPTSAEVRAGIDHIILAFAQSNNTATYEPHVPISTIRSEYPGAKVLVAVGGWADTAGFSEATKTEAGIEKMAADIKIMVDNHGLDGVDIDWEYPGGNGADYKEIPNSEKTHEPAAYPKLLAAIRSAIGQDKILSIAVPAKKVDMIAYTAEYGPRIWKSVDHINLMSYDIMNRRDTETKHHTSVAGSIEALENYIAIGAPVNKINLGFAYYAKYFTTAADCSSQPLGCAIVEAEDPVTGADTGTSGAWTFETQNMAKVNTTGLKTSTDGSCGPAVGLLCDNTCCGQYGFCGTSADHCGTGCQHDFGTGCTGSDIAGSWQSAVEKGVTDEVAGGQYYYDHDNSLFWTWDTPDLFGRKFEQIYRTYGLGGVMAWSLGEDTYDWSHITRMTSELAESTTAQKNHRHEWPGYSRPYGQFKRPWHA